MKLAVSVFIPDEGWGIKIFPNTFNQLGGVTLKTYPTENQASNEADKISQSLMQRGAKLI